MHRHRIVHGVGRNVQREPELIVGVARISRVAAYLLDIDGQAGAVDHADIEILEMVGSARVWRRLVEVPLREGGKTGHPQRGRTAIVLAAASAGFALRAVRHRIVAASGARPDVRPDTLVRPGVRPLLRDVDGEYV